MTDAISRSVAIADFKDWLYRKPRDEFEEGFNAALNGVINRVGNSNVNPALDVAPVVHARWEIVEREAFWIGDQDEWMQTGMPTKRNMPVCSSCKTEFGTAAFEYKHCPHCGARMDGEANE